MHGLSATHSSVPKTLLYALFVFSMASFCAAVAVAGPREDTARAIEAHRQGDFVAAMRWYRAAAEQGYAPAQVRLAYILDRAEENEEAVQWYRKAAEQGDLDGQFGLGQMYANGEGVERDLQQAGRWITQAAEQGLVAAMRVLAAAYERGGLGLSVDQSKALTWLEQAAAREDRASIERLIQVYRNGQLGMAADPGKAEAWKARLTNAQAETEKTNVERLFR